MLIIFFDICIGHTEPQNFSPSKYLFTVYLTDNRKKIQRNEGLQVTVKKFYF